MDTHELIDILLVEDGDADAELILRALRKVSLVNKTTRVRDGVEALEFVYREGAFSRRERGLPKLILLDLHMPRVGGIKVLQTLKSDELTKAIPVVILTSSTEERDLVDTYRLGANSYLVKSVSFVAFTEVVGQAGLYWVVMNRVPPQADH